MRDHHKSSMATMELKAKKGLLVLHQLWKNHGFISLDTMKGGGKCPVFSPCLLAKNHPDIP